MSFEDGMRNLADRAKRDRPGFDRTIDGIARDFMARSTQGEFSGWDFNMISENFLEAVQTKCLKRSRRAPSKRDGKRLR
jgi:hypothetical protein